MAVPVSEPRESPTVSVLICTKDRRQDVARALASLRAAGVEREGVEIVVVEETARPAPMAGVRYVPLPPEGRGFAHVRNRAVDAAKGSVLVFVDDDCEVAPGWLDALLAPLADPEVAGVAGAVLVRDCNAIGYAESILGFPGGGLRYLAGATGAVVPTAFLSTCNCVYRRAAIAGRAATRPAPSSTTSHASVSARSSAGSCAGGGRRCGSCRPRRGRAPASSRSCAARCRCGWPR